MSHIHPARAIPYRDLTRGLAEAVSQGNVTESRDHSGLAIYCYSRQAVYNRIWTPITRLARGLVLDHRQERVVATPFPKFFNVGELDQTIPDLSFEVFEKVDGSLAIIFFHDGCWRVATKGSFISDQAIAAAHHIDTCNLNCLVPGFTYLAEWVSPQNRVVVRYDIAELVLLAAYAAKAAA